MFSKDILYKSAPIAIGANEARLKNKCLAQNTNRYKFQ